MKQASVTLRSLHKDYQSLADKLQGVGLKVDKLETRFDGLETRFDGFEKKFDKLSKTVDDHTESIQYLVANAVTRDEVYQIVDERISPFENRVMTAFDGLSKQMRDVMEEISYNRFVFNRGERRSANICQPII